MNSRNILITGLLLAALPLPVMAVENGIGRTVPGMWVQPQMGVVPTESGLRFTIMPLGYTGSLGGTPQAPRVAPLAGQLVADISAAVSENQLILQYFYKTEYPKIGLASTLYVPVRYQSGTAFVQPNSFSRSSTFTSAGLADVFFSPLTVGIHFSENNNLAIDTKIWAPTGSFDIGNLSNLGMNAWTFTPNLAHTYLWTKRGLEVDNYVAFDIYRQNPATKYTSGAVFHWDGMLFQYLSERGGFGAIASNETQINRDRGPLATRIPRYARTRPSIWRRLNNWKSVFGDLQLVILESGGDNLAATFSPELSDLTIYVIDVAAGDKIPRKGGPGITRSDLLIINKSDLAPYVGASLEVMERDAKVQRGDRPFVFTNLKTGDGLSSVVAFIEKSGMLPPV